MEDPFRLGCEFHLTLFNFSVYVLLSHCTPFMQAISASSSEVSSLLEFLQRRKLEASKVGL